MATERQISANRLNARKSTGPRTTAGKNRASHNAYCYGLRSRLSATGLELDEVENLARIFAGDSTSPIVLEKALTAAEATLQIARIRRLRANLIQEVRRLQILKVSSRAPSVDVQLLSRWLNREMSIRVPDDDPPRLPSQNGNRTGEAIRRLLPQLHVLAGYEWRAWLRREGALRALILGVGGRNGRSRPTKPIYSASPTG